jgi:secreted PhoX family phosphatase
MRLDRRSFLRGGAALAAWSATSLAQPFEALAARGDSEARGYGPLRPVRDDTTGLPLLELPVGFRYVSFGWTGDPMRDGQPTPTGHDGSAVFAARDGLVHYVRNHELMLDRRIPNRTSFAPVEQTYDSGEAPGGVTSVSFDLRQGRALETRPRLSGTIRNCAGGPTPWGTWLSCEENLDEPGSGSNGALLEKSHGWVFEVPPTGPFVPAPIGGLGRFWHEGVAIDPDTGIAYETEDRNSSGLYRFLPNQPGRLRQGGRLEMLAIRGAPGFDTHADAEVGRWMDVTWVPIPEPERSHADPAARDGLGVLTQGLGAGGATFRRGEGIWFGGGRLHFACTSGGRADMGQIFEFDPVGQRLRLVFESQGPEQLNRPDNLTMSPRGGLVMCEDATWSRSYLRGLGPDGGLFDFARNNVQLDGERNGLRGDYKDKEWTGACFSPDGRWLFVNIQWPGISFAITGPWERGPL